MDDRRNRRHDSSSSGTAPPGVEPPGAPRVPMGLLDKLAMVLERLGPSLGYNLFLRLEGPLDLDRLRDAAVACFEDFPILKARVLQRRGRYLFDISHRPSAPDRDEVFSFHDWSAGAAADEHELLRRLVNEPLDIVAGPQLKVMLARLSDREHWLGLKMSHTVGDGVSGIVLMRALASRYETPRERTALPGRMEARGLRCVLKGIPSSRYRAWLRARLSSNAGPPAERDRGGDTPYLVQNIARYGGGNRGVRLGFEVLALSEGELDALEEAARSLGTKPIEVAVGCMLRALCLYNERRDVVGGSYRIGIPIDLRPLASLPMSLGNFSSTIRLRVPTAELGDVRRLVSFLSASLRREKERGSAIVGLGGYAVLSPFTSAVLWWLSRKGALPEGSFLRELPMTYSGPLHEHLLPFGGAAVRDVIGAFQLIPLFMHYRRRFNIVWPYVDDGRIARADIEALFDDVRSELREIGR